jgi:ABC-type multidrug transport system ATPase subunit
MERYLANGGTLLLCSHSMYHIQKLCTHALWLKDGRVERYGMPPMSRKAYLAYHEEKDAVAGGPIGTNGAARAAGTRSTTSCRARRQRSNRALP